MQHRNNTPSFDLMSGMSGFMDALVSEITARIKAELVSLVPEAAAKAAAPANVPTELDPWRLYTAKEVGVFLGVSSKRVHEIPEERLPVHRSGLTGKRKRYVGINILMHMQDLPPVDVQEIGMRMREDFINQATTAAPLPSSSGGRKRVK